MKLVISKSFSKDFKLSRNFNSIGGSVGYGLSTEIEVKDLKDPLIQKTKNQLDIVGNQWVVDEFQDQINIADSEMKAVK